MTCRNIWPRAAQWRGLPNGKRVQFRHRLPRMAVTLRTLALITPLLGLTLQGWAACPMHTVATRSSTVLVHLHCSTHVRSSTPPQTPQQPPETQTPRAGCCELSGCASLMLLPAIQAPLTVGVMRFPLLSSRADRSAPCLFISRLERPPRPIAL